MAGAGKPERLTDKAVAAARSDAGISELWDAVRVGLHLRVFPTGAKVWALRFRLGGRRRRVGLGRYPDTSLAAARGAAKRALEAVARGEDPAAKADAARPGRQLAALRRLAYEVGADLVPRAMSAPTFGALVERYLAERGSALRSHVEVARILRRDPLPAWRNRPVSEIRRADVRALLDVVVGRGSPVSANRLRAALSSVFGFAVDLDILEHNVARETRRPAPEMPRDRVLSDDELEAFWLASGLEHPVVCASFRLLALTGQRSGEVRRLRWCDIDGDLWSIPAAFGKAGRVHVVPLPPPALSILEDLRPLTGRSDWVLESPRRSGEPLAGKLSRAAARVGRRAGVVDWCPHDLRRTVATRVAALGFSEIVGAVLGHAATGVTRRVYDRYDRMAEKRSALAAWSAELQRIVGPRARAFPDSRHRGF